MVITLMVLALVTALSTTVAAVTINNLQSSLRAQEAGAAVSAADAGVAQAMSYLRNTGVRDVDCTIDAPTSAACVNVLWGSAKPISVTIPGKIGQKYEVWIEAVKPFPTYDPGRYVIHSTGKAAGEASRMVTAKVAVTTSAVSKGIYARTISGGGSTSVTRESIFASGCVYQRSKLGMTGMDAAFGIPVAVHSSEIITDSNGSTQYCDGTNKAIHKPGQPCDPQFPYDQDSLGGDLAGTACAAAQTLYPDYYGAQDLDGDGTIDVRGSLLKDEAALFALYDIRTPALSPTKLDQMRAIAQSQGNYWTSSSGWSSPTEANAVMFFDLDPADLGGTVNLNGVTGYSRNGNLGAGDAGCTTKSLTIVIDGGNAKLNSNQRMFASLFLLSDAPNGRLDKANGTADFIGTVYADNVDLTGNVDISLDPCFMSNFSPSLLDFQLSAYRELDR